MKTNLKSTLFALLVTVTPMFAATTQPEAQTKSVRTGVYFSNDGKLNINVENHSDKSARIQIRNSNNEVVYQKHTAGTTPLSAVKLDVEDLPDGEYKVVVSNGKDKVKHTVKLETPAAERTLFVGQ